MQAISAPPGRRKKREPIDPKRGILTYRNLDGPLTDTFWKSVESNSEKIQETHKDELWKIQRCLDIQYAIACEFFWIIEFEPYATISEVPHVLMPCFKNNLIALLSAMMTTIEGLYSFARPSLRLIYESLMVAKFCSINAETEIYDKWIDGEIIYFTNGVLKKISSPASGQFSIFWEAVSKSSHSSIYSMQPDNCIENVEEELNYNFLLMHMLSECNYHILNTHIFTSSLRYYQNRYANPKRLKELREEINKIYSDLRKSYNNDAKQFVRDYKSSWKIRNS